jgi:hypothetical protein
MHHVDWCMVTNSEALTLMMIELESFQMLATTIIQQGLTKNKT